MNYKMTCFVPFNIIWPGIKLVWNKGHQSLLSLFFCISWIILVTKFLSFLCLLVLCSTKWEFSAEHNTWHLVFPIVGKKLLITQNLLNDLKKKKPTNTFPWQPLHTHPHPLGTVPREAELGIVTLCFIFLLVPGWGALCLWATESVPHAENTGKVRGKSDVTTW